MASRRFSIYGLTVETNIPIPGVPVTTNDQAPDVRLTLLADQARVAPDVDRRAWYTSPDVDAAGTPWLAVWRGADYCFDYGEGARFVVASDGSTIEATWQPPLDVADAVSFVLGPVLAFALRLRGVVPLHASGVVIDGHAVLFAGPPGAGKSSTVAALGAMGHQVLSDDVVPLGLRGGRLLANPGFPRVSVWDDTAAAVVGSDSLSLHTWSASYPKRCLDLAHGGIRFFQRPAPVARIYALERRGGDAELERGPLRPSEALVTLAANTFGSYLLDREMHADEFAFLGRVAQAVPIWRLRFPDELQRLQAMCRQLASLDGEPHVVTGSRSVVS